MISDEQLKQLPLRRLKALDGLAVTAEVWEDAHAHHREQSRAHQMLLHGGGIVNGLEVIASDPPDSSVYIKPGAALSPDGNLIVLTQPTTFDIGRSLGGTVHLYLSYAESRPTLSDNAQDANQMYVHAQFSLEAAPVPPSSPVVELARIRRTDRNAPIANPLDPAHPEPNSIDARYRRGIGAPERDIVSIAVCVVGGAREERHARGIEHVARAMRRASGAQVWVDDRMPLTAKLETYTLVYLVGAGGAPLSADEMTGLYNYLQSGGTVLLEACRHDTQGAAPADSLFRELLGSLGIKTGDLSRDHSILMDPNTFGAPPAGFDPATAPRIAMADGVIVSEADYGCVWQGEQRSAPAAREVIRAAQEWGENIIAYAEARQIRRGAKKA